jgi:hypothetical protein
MPEPRSPAGSDQRRPQVMRCRTRYPRPQFQPILKLKGSKQVSVVSPQAIVYEMILLDKVPTRLGKLFIFIVLSMYFIQHCFCFICRPSDFTVSEDAGIEPRSVATLALAVRRCNHSAISHSHPPFNLTLCVNRHIRGPRKLPPMLIS